MAAAGHALLDAVEAAACAQGIGTLPLETGTRQPEALALYEAAGYREIGPFGIYTPDPLSMSMEKSLVSDRS